MNEEMTEIGSVRPVMTVDRHELRKMKTIRIVSRPPMIMVSCTSATASRMKTEPSRTRAIVVPAGSSAWSVATSAFTASATPTAFAPVCLSTSSATARVPSTNASERTSSTESVTSATSARGIGRPLRLAMTMRLNSSTDLARAWTRRGTSLPAPVIRPSGVSMFSARRPRMTSSTPIASASRRSGRISTLISRVTGPTRSTFPTPSTFSSRRFTFVSTSAVRSRGWRLVERTASETIGMPPMSIFSMIGSSMSAGRSPRMAAIFVRASCAARSVLISSWNSTTTCETPSRDVEPTCRTPAIGLTASSIGRDTSRSTVSGEAPG